jgi:hypothetical protein
MSDQSQGPGWWQASDGQWYAPEASYPPPTEPPSGPPGASRPSWWMSPVALWLAIVAVLVALGLGAAIGAAAKSTSSTKTAAPTTTTTTVKPTTTTIPTTTTTTIPTTTTTTAPPQPVVVLEASGSNKTNTDNFTVKGKWTLSCEVDGGAGTLISIKDTSGQQVDFVSFDASGDSVERTGGTFFLEISPYGSTFHVTVTDEVG